MRTSMRDSTVFDLTHATQITAATGAVDAAGLRRVPEPVSWNPWEKRLRVRLWRAFRRLTR